MVGVFREQVVGGQVHQRGAHTVAGDGQVARAERVDLVGLVGVFVRLGAAGQRGAVDDEVGAIRFGVVHDFVQVGDVDFGVGGTFTLAAVVERVLDGSPMRPAAPRSIRFLGGLMGLLSFAGARARALVGIA